MIVQLYSVFDTKVGAYASPFVARTRGEAVRSFAVACGDDQLPFKKHPGDYVLYGVGGWDDVEGRLIGMDRPERIIGADEF